jgi:hypothetical protein
MPSQRYPSKPDLPTPKKNESLILAEYERLCAEIAESSKEASNCVIYSVTGSAALWAWLLTHSDTAQGNFIAAMPVLLTAFLFARWGILQKSMDEIGLYLAETELLYFEGLHGWENHLRPNGKRTGMRWNGWGTPLYFVALLFLTIWMAHDLSSKATEAQKAEAARKQALLTAMEQLTDALSKAVKRQ